MRRGRRGRRLLEAAPRSAGTRVHVGCEVRRAPGAPGGGAHPEPGPGRRAGHLGEPDRRLLLHVGTALGAADPALTRRSWHDRVYSQYVWDTGDLIGRHNHFR